MSRYERVNLHARYRATPLGQATEVREWEVRFFQPGGAANSAFYASRRDAVSDMDRASRGGHRCEGPFPVAR